MARSKKVKRKSKPPSKLKEFICDDTIELEPEPRRSRRTPKISEKLKRYMDEQGCTEEDGVVGKKQIQVAISSGDHKLLGSKYKEPKVILKALPKSVLLKGIRKHPVSKREARVSLKRLGNTVVNKTAKRMVTSKLHKQRVGLRNSSQTVVGKKNLQVVLEDVSASIQTPPQTRKAKRKRVNTEDELEPKTKSSRLSSRASEQKAKQKADSQFDPDVMEKLFSFGSKIEEVLSLNQKEIVKLTKNKKKGQSLSQMVSKRLEDIDEGNINQVLIWLEEEECQRKAHRKKMLESFRASHSTNIALYSQMLSVLQSVTASV